MPQAAKYLFPNKDALQLPLIDQVFGQLTAERVFKWLTTYICFQLQWWEWSMTLLVPMLHQKNISSEPNANILQLLDVVNAALSHSSFVAGSSLSSADISIWVGFSQIVGRAALERTPLVKRWFDCIADLPEVKVIVSYYTDFMYRILITK